VPADTRPVAYCTATHRLIDFLRPDETEEAACVRLAAYSTSLAVLAFDDAWRRHENAARTEPILITEHAWHEALNVLPPVDWRNTACGESFKLAEHTTGAITAIYVRINDRHFMLRDDVRTPHAECCRRVAQSRAYLPEESHEL
jgi:hypothetical protein